MMSLNDVICEDGGRLIELFKDKEKGQLTLRLVPSGVVVGRHKHPKTNEKWWFIFGDGFCRLEFPDGIRESIPFEGGMDKIINVPAGTGHEVATASEVWFLFYADRIYEGPDEEPWEW